MISIADAGIIAAIVISVLGAGRDLIKDHFEKRKLKVHEEVETTMAPAERDSVIVKSAEGVVSLLERGLASAHVTIERQGERITSLEAEAHLKEDRIRELEGENSSLRRQIKMQEGDSDAQRI